MKQQLLTLFLALSGLASLAAEPAIQPGDRVAIIGNTFADQLRIHGYLETLLIQHFRDDPVSIRNFGWGGDMLSARDRPTNFPSEESTLTEHKTDLIIACFGMGESFAGKAGLEDFRSDLRAFIASHRGKKYNGETEVRLVLVSPIACEDHGERTPNHRERNEQLAAYTEAMAVVALEAKIPFVEINSTSAHLFEAAGPKLTTNGIHLNELGYWAISQAVFDQLTERPPWRMVHDANDGLEFESAGPATPTLRPPVDFELSSDLEKLRDQLVIENLEAGTWILTIDGERVATADHETWSRGVPIDASPIHREAEQLRQAVNDKNLQFTYSWKALNQVHIVGERRKSNSGRALPAEIIEFNRLAEEREQALRDLLETKVRTWKLSPAKP